MTSDLSSSLLLAALYHYRALKGSEWMRLSDVLATYGLEKSDTVDLRVEQLKSNYYLEVYGDGVQLTLIGIGQVKSKIGDDNVAAFLEAHGLSHSTQREHDGMGPPVEPDSEGQTIDSATWTGLRNIRISEANRERLKSAIGQSREILEIQLLSNEQKAQALAFLRAAEELADAPEPPSDLIWELINRAGAICGILGLFLTIFLAAVA